MSPRVYPLTPTYMSLFTLLYHTSVLGLLLFVTYILEHHPPYPHTELSSFDSDNMVFMILLGFFIASYTSRRNDGRIFSDDAISDDDTVNSEQQSIANSSQINNDDFSYKNDSITSTNNVNLSEEMSIASSSIDPKKHMEDILLDDDDEILNSASALPNHHQRTSGLLNNKMRPVIAAPTLPCDDILSPRQRQEWKGWMFWLFLCYRVTNASSLHALTGGGMDDVEEGYHNIFINLSRVILTCFIWISGYTHFAYFYKKNDYSSIRVMRVLWRLNFLAFFLCLTHSNSYLLYYVCPLQSYFFFMVYAIMKVNKEVNYDRYKLRVKLLVTALIIYFIWDLDTGLFKLVHLPFFPVGPAEHGATSGPMWEWYFRTSMDHWTAFFGVVFAANAPIFSLFMRKLEAQHTRFQEWAGKLIVGFALLVAVLVWVFGPLQASVLEYSATHCYFIIIPIMAYVFWRNISVSLRQNTLELFYWTGESTLEAYLIHHHALFTSDGDTFLTIIPGWPKMNMFVIGMVYALASRKLHAITCFLSEMLLPNDEKKCGRSLGVIAVTVASFYALASALESLGMMSLGTIAVIIIICGILIYQTVTDVAWNAYHDSAPSKKYNQTDDTSVDAPPDNVLVNSENPIAKLSPPLIGTMVILLMGMTWHTLALDGAGKIQSLPANCALYANFGEWIPIDYCNEFQTGVFSRKYSLSRYGNSCEADAGSSMKQTMMWGWKSTESRDLCRFRSRDAIEMQRKLDHRSLVFIGDSMMRNFYHSICRSVGESDAGKYDATIPKHSDITKIFGNTRIEYKWAPLALDELEKLKDYRDVVEENAPDLVVVGGGAWDRLHVWATDEDQESLKIAVQKLAQEITNMKSRGIPVIWMTPTTINTKALNHEEKRTQMSEEGLQEMRQLYADLGVLAASSFVLDGQGFTKERVGESYDGIHYPAPIYDAGAQILANAMDWVLPTRYDIEPFYPPEPGSLANMSLGLMMLCFVVIGLFFFDCFVGFSYLASLFVNGVMPSDLYEETFNAIHAKMKIPGAVLKTVSNPLFSLESGDRKRNKGWNYNNKSSR